MNEWLRDYLGASPDQRFYEWDLLMNCPDFEALRAEGLLIRDLEAEKSDFLVTRWGRCLDLIRMDGVIFGVDTEDCEDRYVEVDPRELIQYRFNWEPWLQRVQERNGLNGSASWLHRQLVFLGEKTEAGRKLGFLLGFFSQRDAAMDLLLSLPTRMPTGYDALVVTTLAFDRLPQQDIANLERLAIYVVPPINSETLEIAMPHLPVKQPPPTQVSLWPNGEGEFGQYNSQPLIYITGDRGKWNTNTVLVNGLPVRLGDSLFTLFLRLVVQTLANGRSTVTKAALRSGGYLRAGAEEQTIGHLRKAFSKALRNLGVQDLIQSSGRGAIRLSIPPARLKYNRDNLLQHGSEKIRRLAEQLPHSPLRPVGLG
jgi:hypothetical protein